MGFKRAQKFPYLKCAAQLIKGVNVLILLYCVNNNTVLVLCTNMKII